MSNIFLSFQKNVTEFLNNYSMGLKASFSKANYIVLSFKFLFTKLCTNCTNFIQLHGDIYNFVTMLICVVMNYLFRKDSLYM
jgi:hypothetical protein